jgi:uncharacterized protein YecA (UPF0149 family)
MAKDRLGDRFFKRQEKDKLGDRARKARTTEDLEEEEQVIRDADTVEPLKAKTEPGRNDPCPCGSGKKYKKCCGAKK